MFGRWMPPMMTPRSRQSFHSVQGGLFGAALVASQDSVVACNLSITAKLRLGRPALKFREKS
jgi:hypothetical protein